MPYTSYLLKKFDHTHENTFFRSISASLEESYNDQPGLHVLMGNLSCNGNQLDALFITRGQVTLLDFKDYEGRLRFSENSPWQLTTNEGKTLFVMGGAAGRNPYHQLFAYKNGLAEFLYEKQGAILEKNHLNINWRHIGGLVLFQRSIDFDNEKLPVKISRWFKVHTKEDIINGINARYSKSLELSDQEIAAILKAFDIKEIHLTKNHRFIEKREKQGQNRSVDGSKLLFIRKMLKAPVPTTDFKKALFYYKTLIKAERSKSTTVSDAVKIPINAVGGIEQISIPLNPSSPFYDIYLKDGAKQFPKDVFVGLDVVFNKESHTLFHTVIPRSELQDKTSIALNVNEMELSSSALEDLGLGEDLIAEIQARMDAKTKLLDRMEVLQGLLGVAVSMGSDFVLGLSNEEKYTVQLEAELDKIQNTAVAANGLFENFLLNREVSKQN